MSHSRRCCLPALGSRLTRFEFRTLGAAARKKAPMGFERQKRYPAGTSNSTNFRLTRQKSELFQRLALQLRFAADKDSLPTDSGHFVPVLLDPAARLEPGARWVNS